MNANFELIKAGLMTSLGFDLDSGTEIVEYYASIISPTYSHKMEKDMTKLAEEINGKISNLFLTLDKIVVEHKQNKQDEINDDQLNKYSKKIEKLKIPFIDSKLFIRKIEKYIIMIKRGDASLNDLGYPIIGNLLHSLFDKKKIKKLSEKIGSDKPEDRDIQQLYNAIILLKKIVDKGYAKPYLLEFCSEAFVKTLNEFKIKHTIENYEKFAKDLL